MDPEEDKTKAMAFDFFSHLDSMPLPSNPAGIKSPVYVVQISGYFE